VVIRSLTPKDADAFRLLRLKALTEHPDSFGASAEEFAEKSLEQIENRLKPLGDDFVLGAWDQEQLIGMVGMFRCKNQKEKHKATVWGMYVVPEARRRQVGKKLLAALLQRARQTLGIEQLHLNVAAHNEAPRNLYCSLGFEVFGLEKKGLKVNGQYVDVEHMVLFL